MVITLHTGPFLYASRPNYSLLLAATHSITWDSHETSKVVNTLYHPYVYCLASVYTAAARAPQTIQLGDNGCERTDKNGLILF